LVVFVLSNLVKRRSIKWTWTVATQATFFVLKEKDDE
jgi:hypothetical protein